MYSRDVFPRYSSGGMPIPENYSGNAIRRTPPRGAGGHGLPSGHSIAGNAAPPSGHSTVGNGSTPMTHTHGGSAATGVKKESARSSPRGEVPLTVSPSFSRATAAEERMTSVPSVEEESLAVGEVQDTENAAAERETASVAADGVGAVSVSAGGAGRERQEGGISSLLSSFLPPKPGSGGLLSHIGLEETLLLGLFLLLSQSEEDEDTLMLLALLFLYR